MFHDFAPYFLFTYFIPRPLFGFLGYTIQNKNIEKHRYIYNFILFFYVPDYQEIPSSSNIPQTVQWTSNQNVNSYNTQLSIQTENLNTNHQTQVYSPTDIYQEIQNNEGMSLNTYKTDIRKKTGVELPVHCVFTI